MSRRIINEFGVQIYGATIGDTWAGLVRAVLDLGSQCFDEDRERIALSNVRIKSSVQNYPDLTIEEHCNSDQLKAMLDFMFNTDPWRISMWSRASVVAQKATIAG